MPRSSITQPEPAPHKCENCGEPRLYTTAEPLCWVCYRLFITVKLEAAAEEKLWKDQEVIPG